MERWLSFLLIATLLGGQCLCLLPRLSVLQATSRQSFSTINPKPFKHTCYLFAENDNNEIDVSTNLELQENITETIEGNDTENSTITIEESGLAHYFSRREFIGLGSVAVLLSALYYYYQPGTYVPKPVDPVTSVGNEIIYEEALLPYSSVRQFKSITLSNGMEVLLVQDKTAVQSTAALTIRGAGQFSDPSDLGGLAHLMEHMTLAARRRFSLTSSRKASLDFEEWLINYDGSSNGFTAYEKVCFHFMSPSDVFQEALQRFSALFLEETIEEVCRNDDTLKREIRRVNSEFDFADVNTGFMYLVKSLFNTDHPYSRFTAGDLRSLEVNPLEAGVDVGERLFEFFQDHYLPTRSILVAVSPSDLASLEAWVAPFASTLSSKRITESDDTTESSDNALKRMFPEPFPKRSRISPICLFRSKSKSGNNALGDKFEKLSFLWPLCLDYSTVDPQEGQQVITASQIGFVIAQIFGRRGPGSVYNLLRRRKWIPDGTNGIPRVSFPVDVSGFQLMKLELTLTMDGFSSRSAVIAAIYDAINSLESSDPLSNSPFILKRNLLSQYATVAQLYGSVLAPRPPDAVELAFDAQIYGVESVSGCQWRRFPLPQDSSGILNIQRCLADTLMQMSDPTNAIIVVTASALAIKTAQANVFEDSLPRMSPASWNIEPRTGARYFFENSFRLSGRVNEWLVAKLMEDELSPPNIDNLIVSIIRPPRVRTEQTYKRYQDSPLVLEDTAEKQDQPIKSRIGARSLTPEVNIEVPSRTSIVRDYWAILQVMGQDSLPPLFLPRAPPEPSCRCVFVLQLLSARPARARVEMAANAELWRVSCESALEDLVSSQMLISLVTPNLLRQLTQMLL